MTNGSLMKVESIAECSPWSILQYFWSPLRDSLENQFLVIFESGRFTQNLMYTVKPQKFEFRFFEILAKSK